MTEKEKIEVCDETMIIGVDTDEKTVVIENIDMGKVQIDGATIAICDYCNTKIGKYSELKEEDLISPEKFTMAIKNGLIPPENYIDTFKRLGAGNKEIAKIIENWKIMATQSQTPWALCDKCKVIINKFVDVKVANVVLKSQNMRR